MFYRYVIWQLYMTVLTFFFRQGHPNRQQFLVADTNSLGKWESLRSQFGSLNAVGWTLVFDAATRHCDGPERQHPPVWKCMANEITRCQGRESAQQQDLGLLWENFCQWAVALVYYHLSRVQSLKVAGSLKIDTFCLISPQRHAQQVWIFAFKHDYSLYI